MKLIGLLLLAALLEGAACQYTHGYFNWLARILGYSRSRQHLYGGVDPATPMATDCPAECTCPPILPTAMYCDTRRLKYIPSIPARMKYVYLQDNQIEAIPDSAFDNATNLVWIVLHRNKISNEKISNQVFSKLKNLKRLYLGHNNLTSIPYPLPRSLRELRIAGNKISKIQTNSLEGLDNLTMLLLNDNQLEDVGSSLKDLKSLSILDLSNNHLKKVPHVLPDTVHQLYLDFNHISTIPSEYFKQFLKLQYARISNNELTDQGIPLNTFNVSSLIELDLSHNKLKTIPSVSENLENLYLHANRINDIQKYSQMIGLSEVRVWDDTVSIRGGGVTVAKCVGIFGSTEIKMDSFCGTMGVMNFSKMRVLRLDGNSIRHERLPEEIHHCLRQATIIDI